MVALEQRGEAGARLYAPSAARNREAILAAFRPHLPAEGAVLEIGSGTGEHAVHIVAACPGLSWTPSDPDAASRASIAAWAAHHRLDRVSAPLALDATAPDWSDAAGGPYDAIVSINMIHIAPWAAAEGLLQGAARLLPPGGALILYGPFKQGAATAPSNLAFDADLRARNSEWGVRELEAVAAAAKDFALAAVIEMPSNNLTLVFRRLSHADATP